VDGVEFHSAETAAVGACTFGAIMKDAPRAHMQKAFIQRREQVVDDCVQLATDVEAYNAMNSDEPQIPMLFRLP
jgi:hypothetical protein